LCREPSYIPKTSLEDKYYNEKIIQEKLNERLGISIDIGNIVTIPYYPPKEIDKMGTYLKERLKNRLKRKKIFL
jgi:hypothetical protein